MGLTWAQALIHANTSARVGGYRQHVFRDVRGRWRWHTQWPLEPIGTQPGGSRRAKG